MKNALTLLSLFAVMASASPLVACASHQRQAPQAVVQTAGDARIEGTVYVNDLGDARLHTYVSPFEAFRDASQVVETKDALIVIDPQSLRPYAAELSAYIATLGKPVERVIFATHPSGAAAFEGKPVHASPATTAFVRDGKLAGLLNAFSGFLGERLDQRVIVPGETLPAGSQTIDGVEFVWTRHDQGQPGPNVEFTMPKYGVVFRHITANDSHMLVAAPGHIDALIADTEALIAGGTKLLLSSHWAPIPGDALSFQLAYLKDARAAAAASKTAAEYMAAMQKKYPTAGAPGFLKMSAEKLYGEK